MGSIHREIIHICDGRAESSWIMRSLLLHSFFSALSLLIISGFSPGKFFHRVTSRDFINIDFRATLRTVVIEAWIWRVMRIVNDVFAVDSIHNLNCSIKADFIQSLLSTTWVAFKYQRMPLCNWRVVIRQETLYLIFHLKTMMALRFNSIWIEHWLQLTGNVKNQVCKRTWEVHKST